MSNGGYVYLLCDQSKDRIYKIGVTRGSIEKRIKKLQTGNSGEITLSRYFKSDYPFIVEKMMHMKYTGNNIRNEWFELDDESAFDFPKECEKFENNLKSLKDNPFFNKKQNANNYGKRNDKNV